MATKTFTLENGNTINLQARVVTYFRTEISTKALYLKVKRVAKENTSIKTQTGTKDIGKTTTRTARVNISIPTATPTKVDT